MERPLTSIEVNSSISRRDICIRDGDEYMGWGFVIVCMPVQKQESGRALCGQECTPVRPGQL